MSRPADGLAKVVGRFVGFLKFGPRSVPISTGDLIVGQTIVGLTIMQAKIGPHKHPIKLFQPFPRVS
jgi:hypothetical protein